MSTNEEERKARIKHEICSVATKEMDIEPEDDYSRKPVYCLKHKYLTKHEYWLEHTDTTAHRGLRIHKCSINPCPRRNFVDLFTKVNSFNDSQARYIAKTVAYLIECVAPSEQDVSDTILENYTRDHKQYCFNYYRSVSHLENFYVVDGFVKFHDDNLSEHIKIHFDVWRDDFHIHRNIHFYVYGDKLICSADMGDINYVEVDRNEDHKVLACKILSSMIAPLLDGLEGSQETITPDNAKVMFSKFSEFKQLADMVEI